MADSIPRDVTDRVPAGRVHPMSGLEVSACPAGLLALLVGLLGAVPERTLRHSTSSAESTDSRI